MKLQNKRNILTYNVLRDVYLSLNPMQLKQNLSPKNPEWPWKRINKTEILQSTAKKKADPPPDKKQIQNESMEEKFDVKIKMVVENWNLVVYLCINMSIST